MKRLPESLLKLQNHVLKVKDLSSIAVMVGHRGAGHTGPRKFVADHFPSLKFFNQDLTATRKVLEQPNATSQMVIETGASRVCVCVFVCVCTGSRARMCVCVSMCLRWWIGGLVAFACAVADHNNSHTPFLSSSRSSSQRSKGRAGSTRQDIARNLGHACFKRTGGAG